MNPRAASLISAVTVAAILLAALVPAAEASSDGDYYSQLDENGQALYTYMEKLFEDSYEDPQAEMEVTYQLTDPVLFGYDPDDAASVAEAYADATEYANGLVNDVLAALYLTDPYPIWLWDYPVTSVEVSSMSTKTVEIEDSECFYVHSVTFALSVPDEYSDSVAETIAAVDEACSEYTGTTQEIVVSINDALRGITVSEDEDGSVSSIYDALVTGESSSAGIAAAFTHLCASNGVTAVTVRGGLIDGEETVEGYWNAVLMDGSWYAVDCTLNSSTSENCLLVGWSTSVTYDSTLLGFGATRSADLDMASPNTLQAPSITAVGVDWSEEPSFLDKYGEYIALAVIMLVIAGTIAYAIYKGNV